MADVLTPEQRQRCMSRVKNKGTAPELQLRKALWSNGLRYRLDYKLPGKPDLVFVGSKLAVFVDGCFWHSCPLHGTSPTTNIQFWTEKLLKNQSRDNQVNLQLKELGWTVIRLWEHEVKIDVISCVEKIRTTKGIRK